MANWMCPGCDSFNPDTVEICQYCGRDRAGVSEKVDGTPEVMQSLCQVCQGSNPRGRRICQWCGAELAAPSSLEPEAEEALARQGNALSSPAQPGQPAQAGRTSQPGKPAQQGMSARAGRASQPGKPVQAASQQGAQAAAQQAQLNSQRLRPCSACGLMLAAEEGIVVAGPRLLCRACFHEEFHSDSEDPSKPDASEDAAHPADADASVKADIEEAGAKPRKRGVGIALLGGGILVCGAGGAATYLWSFTWGFSPLMLGALLVVLGVVRLTGQK